MNRILAIGAAMGLLAFGSASLAFEEHKLKQGNAPVVGKAAPGASIAPDLKLATPELASPREAAGTKIRVPGLGVIGEIPKMDFGLELLYGASQPKQLNGDRSEANGVMGRVTVPIKPLR